MRRPPHTSLMRHFYSSAPGINASVPPQLQSIRVEEKHLGLFEHWQFSTGSSLPQTPRLELGCFTPIKGRFYSQQLCLCASFSLSLFFFKCWVVALNKVQKEQIRDVCCRDAASAHSHPLPFCPRRLIFFSLYVDAAFFVSLFPVPITILSHTIPYSHKRWQKNSKKGCLADTATFPLPPPNAKEQKK